MKTKIIIQALIVLFFGLTLFHQQACQKESKENNDLPNVQTLSVSEITQSTAISGGNIISEGASPVISRGVCWNLSQNPNILDDTTLNGSGMGTYTSFITGLKADTSYSVRAYATNSIGTAYGDQISFKTKSNSYGQPCPGIPTITYEGQVYKTVQIASQCWLKENLNVGTRINGASEQTDNSIIEKYCYDDLESNCEIYGGLYQWNEMMNYITDQGTKGICPPGWHIPTSEEWCTLLQSIDSTVNCGYGSSGTDIGFRMKSTNGWVVNGNGNNLSGFTALPSGGYAIDGTYNSLGNYCSFYTSNQTNGADAKFLSLSGNDSQIYISTGYKTVGRSVRCIKDN